LAIGSVDGPGAADDGESVLAIGSVDGPGAADDGESVLAIGSVQRYSCESLWQLGFSDTIPEFADPATTLAVKAKGDITDSHRNGVGGRDCEG
jgi:hypothetical protein